MKCAQPSPRALGAQTVLAPRNGLQPYVCSRHVCNRPSARVVIVASTTLTRSPEALNVDREVTVTRQLEKWLQELGWQRCYAHPVASHLAREEGGDVIERARAVVSYLLSLGVTVSMLENMATLCKPLLAVPVSSMRACVGWLQMSSLTESEVRDLIQQQPALLTFEPSSDGACLVKGLVKARVSSNSGSPTPTVHMWRDSAVLGQSPLAPRFSLTG